MAIYIYIYIYINIKNKTFIFKMLPLYNEMQQGLEQNYI